MRFFRTSRHFLSLIGVVEAGVEDSFLEADTCGGIGPELLSFSFSFPFAFADGEGCNTFSTGFFSFKGTTGFTGTVVTLATGAGGGVGGGGDCAFTFGASTRFSGMGSGSVAARLSNSSSGSSSTTLRCLDDELFTAGLSPRPSSSIAMTS